MVSRHTFHIIPREGQHLILDRDLSKYAKTTICQTPEKLPTGGHTKGMGFMPSVDGTIILGTNADDVDDPDFSDNTRDSPQPTVLPEAAYIRKSKRRAFLPPAE